MNPEEKKVLYGKFDELKKETSTLRNQLQSLQSRKESAFKKKNDISAKIRALIADIKGSRSTRDEFTKQVADSKDRRKQLNEELRQKIEEAKKLNNERTDIMKKHKLQGDPAKLKEEIDHLERRVETEGLSFDKEQKVMKEIKEKKRLYDVAKKVSTVFDRLHELNKDISRLREKADETHRKVQTRANASQEKHEELLETSKEIDTLRSQEKEAIAACNDLKQQFTALNDQVKQKFTELDALREQIEGVRQDSRTQQRKQQEMTLREKQRVVEDKIRKGGKLTTEDLLVMQGTEN